MASFASPIENRTIIYSDLRTISYYSLATLALLLYDWIIALPREVQMFWMGNPGNLSASLYYTNRLIPLSVAGVGAFTLAALPDKVCTRINLANLALKCILNLPPAVFFGLRAHALSQRRGLSFAIFFFCFVPSITNAVQLKYISSVVDPVIGCFTVYDSHVLFNILSITNRACVILAIWADALVLAITWQLLPHGGTPIHRAKFMNGKGLIHVVLRNGAIYSIVMFLLNASDFIWTTYSLLAKDSGLAAMDVSAMTSILRVYLPPVLVSRFLLDLQHAHQQKIVCLSTNGPLDAASCDIGGDSAMFAPALGALSATISSADWGRDERQADDHCAEDAHRNALTKEGAPPVKEVVVSEDGPSPNTRRAPTAISLEAATRPPHWQPEGSWALNIDGPLGEAAAKS